MKITTEEKKTQKYALLTAVVSFLICILVGILILLTNPIYLSSTDQNSNPDAIDYGILCKSLITQGVFSRSSDGRPDPLRTPGYPILLTVFRADLTPIFIYLVQAAMVAFIGWMLATMAGNAFGSMAAIFVGTLIALDHTLHILAWQAMTEISGLFFTVLGLYLLRWPSPMRWDLIPIQRSILSAIVFGVSVMIRPAFLLGPILLVTIGFITRNRKSERVKPSIMFGRIFLFLLFFIILPTLWTVRNSTFFGINQFTPVGTHNMVYFVGAGAYQLELGVDRYQAQALIAEQFHLPTYSTVQSPHSQNEFSVKELESQLASAQWGVVFKYPKSLIMAEVIGLVKGSVAHAVGEFGVMIGNEWKSPGLAGLLSFRKQSYISLGSNSKILVLLFLLHILYIGVLVGSSLLGLFRVIALREFRIELIGIIILIIYGYVTIGMFGIDAVYRSRLIPLPAILLFCGFAVSKPRNSTISAYDIN
jgi:hypothetical protein